MSDKHTTGDDRARGFIDRARVEATTEEEIERQAREDGDEEWTPEMLRRAHWVGRNKKPVYIRLDEDILDFFQREGSGYQSRINAALRAYVDARKAS